jgi:phosphoglycerate dehydrogenase-like enzyme
MAASSRRHIHFYGLVKYGDNLPSAQGLVTKAQPGPPVAGPRCDPSRLCPLSRAVSMLYRTIVNRQTGANAGAPRRKVMPEPKVFVFNPPDEGDAEHERMTRAGCAMSYAKGNWSAGTGNTEEELAEMSVGADALIGNSMRYARVTREVMKAAPNLRVVAKSSVGVDDVDVDAATELGILVCHAPTEVNCYGVAEGTVTMILAKLKKVRERDEAIHAGMWRERSLEGIYVARRKADDYPGITLGLVGLGRIARRVCQLFAPWNFRIVAYDPYVDDATFERVGAERVDLETLLKESDVVSMHVVSTKETRGMMSADQFALMKPPSSSTLRAATWWTSRRWSARSMRTALRAPRSTCSRPSRCPPTRRSARSARR